MEPRTLLCLPVASAENICPQVSSLALNLGWAPERSL